ncbi:MAG: succinylglutamate desuccinylase/aspartoacylase family protein [Rubrivivax sp.]
MKVETLTFGPGSPGLRHQLTVLHFGQPGSGPKAYIQAALHADEVPAMLVAHHLRSQLQALDGAGQIVGEVVLVPFANPLGLAQRVLGQHVGRFDLRDGVNFNREVPDLTEAVAAAVEGRLGDDAAANVALVRQALRDAAAALTAAHPAADLKRRLLQLAVDADIVLDLHTDADALLHLYGLTPQQGLCEELGALLGARAILLATDCGDCPFDEACSRPWLALQQRFAAHPLPLACFATTVELRGAADTDHRLAQQDAAALIEFLRRRGVVLGTPGALPPLLCQATPLAGCEPLLALASGVLVFSRDPGERIEAGGTVAEIVDVESGTTHAVRAQAAGLLFARIDTRWATAGKPVAKIAGQQALRSGKLLGD